jgi:thioesterase domain-containing protein
VSTRYRRPQGSFEVLASICGAVLGVEQVGLDDDLVAMCGDEHGPADLADAVYEYFGLPVSEAMVRAAPTVEQLGSRLGRRRARGAPLVLPLSTRDHGGATPLFCVVGCGAPATQFHAFADAMDHRPVYGIQQRGLEERARPDRTVAAYARRALEEVRAIHPEGPYLVAGHSYGGPVAFEMACQLTAAGADVGLLVIMDVPVVPWPSAAVVRARGASRRRIVHENVMRLKRSLRRVKLSTLGLVTRRGLHQYDAFYLLGLHIGRRYDPRMQCAAPTLVVRAQDVDYFPDPVKSLPDLGWAPRVTGPLMCADAPGNHLTMVRRPYAASLAEIIEGAITVGH